MHPRYLCWALVSLVTPTLAAENLPRRGDFSLAGGGNSVAYSEVAAEPTPSGDPLGRVAILKDDLPAVGAPAAPDHLAEVLRQANFAVTFLDSQQLAAGSGLNRALFDVLVLPYGASFPVAAADNFRQFLRAGGKFFSTGGYAFDALWARTERGWKPPSPILAPAVNHVIWHCEIPAGELRDRGPLTFSGWLKADQVTGPGMAFFAVYQIAADGTFPEWKDICRVTGTQDWREFSHRFEVHPSAATVDLRAGLFQCGGVACFDDLRLTNGAGDVLLASGFEEDFDPDQNAPHRWTRSDRQRCQVQTSSRRSGQRALRAELDFVVPRPERLNTRHGIPADGLEVEPTQLGVFQADYVLERVAFAEAASGQSVLEPSLRLEGELEGWAACGVVGFDRARWIPLLHTYDRYGRLRGAAGGMVRHYAGPYAGSSWAFFGVTNRDLFARSDKAMSDTFVRIVGSLVEDTYCASLVPERACYRPGEKVKLRAAIVNGGRHGRTLRLRLELFPGDPPRGGMAFSRQPVSAAARVRVPATTLEQTVTVSPGDPVSVSLEWDPPRFESDFYHVVGQLWEGKRELDRGESGFVVWDERVVAAGPSLTYANNYLQVQGRPMFLFGTDDWGYIFNTRRETPLQWLLDMRQRRDLGVQIYENLQFGLPGSAVEQENLLNKVDGVVQLAQKCQQIYFPCLLCGYNVAADDADLARQAQFCGAYAARYARVPGLVYYLNGDLRCQLSEAVTPQWNQFLRQRYGTTENLRQAWGPQAPPQELGSITAEDFNDWGHAWGNQKVCDQNQFRAWLIRRWNEALIAAIRRHDRVHPTTCEFYQLPHQGVDIPAGIDGLDLANFGYFDRPGADLRRFPAICKLNDQRARGKSGGPGEYGVKTHPAWGDGQDYNYHIARTREQAVELFLAIAHDSLGLGASRIHNWCWKDDAHRVFPWGMIYPCDGVPKDTAYVHRNLSLLFRHFAPVYHEPSVYVLTADSHRFGGGKWQVIEGILQGIDLALAAHVDNLGTLNELDLVIPPGAKAILYPLPFCPPDVVYGRLLQWVRAGGVLYLSGDISYDEQRRRSRLERLEELCGARFVAVNYPDIAVATNSAADQPCILVEPKGATVLSRTPDGKPLLMRHEVGRGQVFFNADPVELHSLPERRAADVQLYRKVLDAAQVRPIALDPNNPMVRVSRLPLRDGGQVHILFNADESEPVQTLTLTDQVPPMRLAVAHRRPALIWRDSSDAVRAVEAQGDCFVGDERVVRDETGGIALTLDGLDLRRSRAILLLPLAAGRIHLRSPDAWREPVVETGEIVGGSWQTFEVDAPRAEDGDMVLDVAPHQAFSLLLLTEKGEAARWREAVGRAVTHPHLLP